MGFPASATLVTVTETYVAGDGTLETGTVEFTPSTRVYWDSDGILITLDTVVAQVVAGVLKNAAGTGSLQLPATDDADGRPSGWTWRVIEKVGGRTTKARYVQLPGSPSTRILHTLSDVEPAAPGFVRVLTVNGIPPDAAGNIDTGASAVTSVDSRTGAVTLTDLYAGAAATTAALAAKAPLASPTFTGTVSGITKGMVGLGNADNTSDANKPISTATQSALDLKAPLASPTFTGTVSGVSKSMVGLGNVDNTSDANKPISTATQTALDAKATKLIHRSAVVTSGNIQLNTGTNTWGPLTNSPTLVIPAAAGDLIGLSQTVIRQANANIFLDVGVLVSSAIVRYLATMSSTPAGEGDPGLYHTALPAKSAERRFVVASGDLSGGNVTFTMAIRNTTGASSLLLADTNTPFQWSAINYGAVS